MEDKDPHWLAAWLIPNFRRDQYLIYLIGCVLFSFGANFFIHSKLGTDPLDVFSLGLRAHVPFMTVGIAQGGFALICLFIWSIWNKRLPLLSPFVTFFICGTLIDIFMGEKIRVGVNVAPQHILFAGSGLGAFQRGLGVYCCVRWGSVFISGRLFDWHFLLVGRLYLPGHGLAW